VKKESEVEDGGDLYSCELVQGTIHSLTLSSISFDDTGTGCAWSTALGFLHPTAWPRIMFGEDFHYRI
jgi:hypothetical protein